MSITWPAPPMVPATQQTHRVKEIAGIEMPGRLQNPSEACDNIADELFSLNIDADHVYKFIQTMHNLY